MSLTKIYEIFPNKTECLHFLANIRWPDGVRCLYCSGSHVYYRKYDIRYQCYRCNRVFSITAKSLLQNTKVPLQKWFYAIELYYEFEKITIGKLVIKLKITKKSARLLLAQLKKSKRENSDLFSEIYTTLKLIK